MIGNEVTDDDDDDELYDEVVDNYVSWEDICSNHIFIFQLIMYFQFVFVFLYSVVCIDSLLYWYDCV